MKNIKHLLDVVDKVRDHVALGMMSDPGLSKTSQVKQWAEENGRKYCELIISQRMPSEISGMPMPVPDTQKMEIFDFDTLLQLKDGDVLAFDEFTNGNIQTLNACLTLIQERTMLSGKKLPSLVIVAMGNPQGRCDLLPQTKQRFLWVDVKWDASTWKRYIQEQWGLVVDKMLLDEISGQYRKGFGDSQEYNYMTPRTVENLLRIAMNIRPDDPFWKVSHIHNGIVDALYRTIGKKDKFTLIKEQINEWIDSQDLSLKFEMGNGINIEPAPRMMALESIKQCNSMNRLRELLITLESENIIPDFFEWLQQADLSMSESDNPNSDIG